MMRLSGKVALVTGSARGIGKAILERFAAEGAFVVVSDVAGEEAAREALAAIVARGGQGAVEMFDVAEADQVERALGAVVASRGRIDVVVNNAGITRDALLMRMGDDDFDAVVKVNLRGTYLVTKAAARVMVKQRSGRIVNVSSVVGQMGNFGQTNYAAAKAGILGFTKSAARELAPRGITVNAIAPGFITTAMTDKLPENVRSAFLAQIPLGRFGTAEEVAELAAFLASDGAGYITGQVIGVNGGLYM